MRTQCPYCEKKYNVSASALDKQVRCINSDCGKSFKAFDLSAPQGRAVAVALEEPPENNKSFSIAPPPLPKDGAKKINDIQNLFAGYPAPGLSKKLLISIASVIVGFLILFLSFLLWAFGSRNIGAADIAGCYIDENDPNALLEFKENGRFCLSSATMGDSPGEWRIKENKLFVSPDTSSSFVCNVKGNKIIDNDGMVWTKEETVVSEVTVPGRYVVRATTLVEFIPGLGGPSESILDIYGDRTVRYESKKIRSSEPPFVGTGNWELNGNRLKINYKNYDAGYGKKEFIEGEFGQSIEGKIIGFVFHSNSGWFVKEK